MIKIQEYNKKENKVTFVTDMSLSLANAIRRSSLEIPVMAIDEVEITKNDSALYDELIAHRIGLIPIKTEKAIKETKFKLKVKGPKTVYSTDIEPSIGTDLKIPITILEEEQEVEIVGDARLGKGTEHIKYAPGLIFYKHNVEDNVLDHVTIDDEGNVTIDEDELKSRGMSDDEIKKLKKITKVDELLFTIESWGQLDPKEIFPKAIEALEENLLELDKAVSK